MKRKIVVSTLIGYNFIEINANVEINNELVCIFNKNEKLKNQLSGNNFIKSSIKEIENNLSIKVEYINLILDDFSLPNSLTSIDTKILNKTFQNFKNSSITLNENNYWEFQTSIKNDIDNYEKMKLISLIPLKFVIKNKYDEEELNYSEFPIGKQTSKISCSFCAKYISSEFYKQINILFESINIKFDNILLLSQLSLYKFNKQISNKLTFTIDIQAKKSMLITSLSKIVINKNDLSFSYNDLVNRFSNTHNISRDDALNLIKIYGDSVVNSYSDTNEIIYLTSEDDNCITKNDLIKVIKSFLKTLSLEVKQIIEQKIDKESVYDINIVGKLENVSDIGLYCSKYMQTKNIISNTTNNQTYYQWNKSYQTHINLLKFINVIDKKIRPLFFESNRQNILSNPSKKQSLFKKIQKRSQNIVLI